MPRRLAGFTELEVPRTPPLVEVAPDISAHDSIEIPCIS